MTTGQAGELLPAKGTPDGVSGCGPVHAADGDGGPAAGPDPAEACRAGVINLWDYVDEEFAFADGRLALRGHNGSGKTKALEVLFPFILDGSMDARRLDPFSGENRTMKANLLYRGQEAEYGYVWMEFGGPHDETVTLVIGLKRTGTGIARARRSMSRTSEWAWISGCCPRIPVH